MTEQGEGKSKAPMVFAAVSVVALLVALGSLGLALYKPAPARPAPQTVETRLVIASFEPHNASMMMEEVHMFMPGTLYANAGDTIVLTVVNMDEHRHGFEIHALNVETDPLTEIMPGEEVTITFTAPAPGTYEFECSVPYVPPTPPATEHEDCGEDHEEMRGYLVVQ